LDEFKGGRPASLCHCSTAVAIPAGFSERFDEKFHEKIH
jgi:hypothetical protein